MKDYRFEAQQEAILIHAAAQLARLVPLLAEAPTPGDRMMLLATIDQVGRAASLAAATLRRYQETMMSRAAETEMRLRVKEAMR